MPVDLSAAAAALAAPLNVIAAALDPAWIAAVSAAIGGAIGLRVVIHWFMIRRVVRGSSGAIITLLSNPLCEAVVFDDPADDNTGLILVENKITYFKVGTARYLLCRWDLSRLCKEGYVSQIGECYRLSRLGQLLLERYDNGRLFAKSVARAHQSNRFCCPGGHLVGCSCAKYRLIVYGHRVPLPFFVGQWCKRAERNAVLMARTGGTSTHSKEDTL